MDDFFAHLEFELAVAHEKPFIAVGVQVKAGANFFGAKSVEDDAAIFVVFAGNFDVEGGFEEFEGLVVAVGSGLDEEWLGGGLKSLSYYCGD
ncbi:MAG TPA: hypothetical protein VGJ06_22125 [Candidatus Acidoferrum sp.]|jgi:hypothetical protein